MEIALPKKKLNDLLNSVLQTCSLNTLLAHLSLSCFSSRISRICLENCFNARMTPGESKRARCSLAIDLNQGAFRGLLTG
jgi:hypothetical protein